MRGLAEAAPAASPRPREQSPCVPASASLRLCASPAASPCAGLEARGPVVREGRAWGTQASTSPALILHEVRSPEARRPPGPGRVSHSRARGPGGLAGPTSSCQLGKDEASCWNQQTVSQCPVQGRGTSLPAKLRPRLAERPLQTRGPCQTSGNGGDRGAERHTGNRGHLRNDTGTPRGDVGTRAAGEVALQGQTRECHTIP